MRCIILFSTHTFIDDRALTQQLMIEGFHTHITQIASLVGLDQILQDNIFDTFVLEADTPTLLKAAQELLNVTLGYKLSTVFIQTDADEKAILTLKDLGIKNILPERPSEKVLATYLITALHKDRHKNELLSMGSFMQEATVHLEYTPDDNFCITKVNKAFLEIEGVREESFLHKNIDAIHSVFGLKNFREELQEVFQTGSPIHLPNYFYLKEGRRHWFSVHIYRPNPQEVTIIASDLSELKSALDKVTKSNSYLQTILNAQRHIIFITNGEKLINTNKSFLKFFGLDTMYEFINKHANVCLLFDESDDPAYIGNNDPSWLEKVVSHPDQIFKIRIKYNDRAATFVPSVETINVDMQDQYVVTLTDVTELEYEKERLRVIAMTDTLTGAFNRFKFNTMIEEQLAASNRYDAPLSIVMLDVDNFKRINDAFSHIEGDKVLKRLSDLIRQHIRRSDLFVRWGGDEFLLLLPSTSLENAQITVQKLIDEISHNDFGTHKEFTCSFGLTALTPQDSVSTLISRADEALYIAKKEGKNRFKVLS